MNKSWNHLSPERKALLLAHGGDHVVAVRPIVVKALRGNGNAAIFLSQLLYWSRRSPDPEGWFYNTRERLEEQTGLGKDAQLAARKLLTSLGILNAERRGVPPIVHFRLDLDKLADLIVSAMPDNRTEDISDNRTEGMVDNSTSGMVDNPYKETTKDSERDIPPDPQRGTVIVFPSGTPSDRKRTAKQQGGETEATPPPPTPAPLLDSKALEQAEARMLDTGRALHSKSSRRVENDQNGWATQPPERVQKLKDGIWNLWRQLNPERVTRKDIDRLPWSVAPDEVERFKTQTRAYLNGVDNTQMLMSLRRWIDEWRDWAPSSKSPAPSYGGRQVGPSASEEIALKLSMDGRKIG